MGAKFWLGMIGGILVIGIGVFLAFAVFVGIWSQVGVIAAFAFIGLLLVLVAAWADRRRANPDY